MTFIESVAKAGRCGVVMTTLLSVGVMAQSARADLLELINGDHYRGTVVSMNSSNVEFISEIQGRVTLPRSKVAQITFRDVKPKVAVQPTTNAPLILSGPTSPPAPAPATATTRGPTTVNVVVDQMRSQGIDPKIVSQVQEQIFGKASPEAAAKFTETMNGLMSGQISVSDIRNQAQSAIDQIQKTKRDLGPDAADMLDGYLDILQKFVQAANVDQTITAATPPATK